MMAPPERTARLLLGLLLLALGVWPWIIDTWSSLPLPTSTIFFRDLSSIILIITRTGRDLSREDSEDRDSFQGEGSGMSLVVLTPTCVEKLSNLAPASYCLDPTD